MGVKPLVWAASIRLVSRFFSLPL